MISYYNSKHPGLIVYITLVGLSIITFSFMPPQNWTIGLLVMAWSFYIFLRVLSLFEATDFPAPLHGYGRSSRETLRLPSALPHDLITRMDGKDRLKRAQLAMNALSPRSLVWLLLALLYMGFEIYKDIHNLSPAPAIFTIPQKISIFFMIGAAFWAGQTYAYSNSVTTILLYIFGGFFSLCLIARYTIVTEFYIPPFKLEGESVLIFLATYSSLILLPSLLKTKKHALNGLMGLCLMGLMVTCYLFLPFSSQNIPIWISGWSLFSLFWIRSEKMERKIYRLQV